MDLTTDLITSRDLLPTVFDSDKNIEAMIAAAEHDARSLTHDVNTEDGRKGIASLRRKVSRSKTAMQAIGDPLAAAYREKWDELNVLRRKVVDRFDALRDEIGKPLDDWWTAEAQRIEAHGDRLLALKAVCYLTMALGSAAIRDQLDAARDITLGEEWEEFQDAAREARESAIAHLCDILGAAETAERAAAELDQLRRDKAERDETDRIAAREREQEDREKRAADRARWEAQEKAAAVLEAEKDRAELEVSQAKLRADKAEQDAREAVERERAEVTRVEKIHRDAKVKREADEAHRERIHAAAGEALIVSCYLSEEVSDAVLNAITDGQIPHVAITY